jgi:hypothetical protein
MATYRPPRLRKGTKMWLAQAQFRLRTMTSNWRGSLSLPLRVVKSQIRTWFGLNATPSHPNADFMPGFSKVGVRLQITVLTSQQSTSTSIITYSGPAMTASGRPRLELLLEKGVHTTYCYHLLIRITLCSIHSEDEFRRSTHDLSIVAPPIAVNAAQIPKFISQKSDIACYRLKSRQQEDPASTSRKLIPHSYSTLAMPKCPRNTTKLRPGH